MENFQKVHLFDMLVELVEMANPEYEGFDRMMPRECLDKISDITDHVETLMAEAIADAVAAAIAQASESGLSPQAAP